LPIEAQVKGLGVLVATGLVVGVGEALLLAGIQQMIVVDPSQSLTS